jgi:hypothetical protein
MLASRTAAVLLAVAVGGAACAPTKPSDQPRPGDEPASGAGEEERAQAGSEKRRTIVARVNGESFTLAELENRLDRLPAYIRTRYQGPGAKEDGPVEKKQEYLRGLVQFELLADVAEARGLGDHPHVRHRIKRHLADRALDEVLRREISMSDIPKADIEQRYRQHRDRYREAEKRQTLAIVTGRRERAERLRERLTTREYDGVDHKIEVFRRVASRASVDPASARRGGALGSVSPPADEKEHPAVAEVVYGLDKRAELSEVFRVDDRWYVAMWAQHREPSTTPLAEVERELRTELYEERKAELRDERTATWRREATIERDDGLASRLEAPEPPRKVRTDEIPIVAASEVDDEQTHSSNDD